MEVEVGQLDVIGVWLENLIKKWKYAGHVQVSPQRCVRMYQEGTDPEGFGIQISPRGNNTMALELFGPLYSRNSEYERHIIDLADPASMTEAETAVVKYFVFMDRWEREHGPSGR